MKIKVALLCCLLLQGSVYAKDCDSLKERADYWNDKLKMRVSESKREQHRRAKAKYLECIRLPVHNNEVQSTRTNEGAGPKSYAANTKQAGLSRSKHHIYISAGMFKGKKQRAWQSFYQEPDDCKSSSGDMKKFVECTELRRPYLMEFNRRWDEENGQLKPVLSPRSKDKIISTHER